MWGDGLLENLTDSRNGSVVGFFMKTVDIIKSLHHLPLFDKVPLERLYPRCDRIMGNQKVAFGRCEEGCLGHFVKPEVHIYLGGTGIVAAHAVNF